MVASLIHFSLACVVAYFIFYTVHYRDTNDEETNNDDSLTASDMGPIVPQEELLHKVLDDRFVIGEIIAVGRVATIRQGVDLTTGADVAIKLAHPDVSGELANLLENEYRNYVQLKNEDESMVGVGIPNVLYFGAYGGYKYLVMDILGSTLHDLKELTGKNKLFGKTIAKIAIQAIDIFEYIHSKGLTVQDISASNMAIGYTMEALNKVYMFDFASSMPISHEHLPAKDLIGFGLVLLNLNGIEFPRLRATSTGQITSNIDEIIEQLMLEWNGHYVEDLYVQSDISEIFQQYFEYLTSLTADEPINYKELKDIFVAALTIADLKKQSLGILDAMF